MREPVVRAVQAGQSQYTLKRTRERRDSQVQEVHGAVLAKLPVVQPGQLVDGHCPRVPHQFVLEDKLLDKGRLPEVSRYLPRSLSPGTSSVCDERTPSVVGATAERTHAVVERRKAISTIVVRVIRVVCGIIGVIRIVSALGDGTRSSRVAKGAIGSVGNGAVTSIAVVANTAVLAVVDAVLVAITSGCVGECLTIEGRSVCSISVAAIVRIVRIVW